MRVRAHLDGAGRYWQVRVSTPVDLSGPVPGQWELPGFEVGQGDLFDAIDDHDLLSSLTSTKQARGRAKGE